MIDSRPSTGASDPNYYDKPLPPLRTGLDEPWNAPPRSESRQRHHTPTGSYDGKPLPLTTDTLDGPLQGPRKPNMSLFSLFSRPKVQKLRGYAESGLSTPSRNEASISRLDLIDGSQHPRQEIPRSTSSMSFRAAHRTQGSNHKVKHATTRRVSQDHRTLNYDAPPLFQAFARSTKNGLVEISTATPETVIAKSRTKRVGALHVPTETTARGSTDTTRSGDAVRLGRFASRTSGPMSVTQVDVERKIIVLVTTGHLLQYSEYGPSGRLPEKVLVLGESSAAFASDLISGRPYVCQISQEVDRDGVPVAPSGSLFSKVGIKSSAEKKMITNILLVLPDGDELNTWLGAVRKQIEELGGPPSNPEEPEQRYSVDRRSSRLSEQHDDPAPMQRYHIRRASRASSEASAHATQAQQAVVSPIDVPTDAPTALPAAAPTDAPTDALTEASKNTETTSHARVKSKDSIEEAMTFAEVLAAGASYTKPKSSDEEAEAFGDILAAGASYTKPGSTRARRPSDSISVNSSIAQSVDHLRLNSLRNSVRMSTNTNVTGYTSRSNSRANSRTNSLTSEHIPNKHSLDSPNDAYGPRGPYRTLSSYGSGSTKRRSAMPSPQAPSAAGIDLTIKTKISPSKLDDLGEDSPVMGWNASTITALPPIAPRGKVLSSRQSMPLLTDPSSKHDSKVLPPPPITESGERPQSFVAELPSAAHWTTKLSTGKRGSMMQPMPQMHRMSSAPSLRASALSSSPKAARRNTSQPFTLPLKINPSGTAASGSWQNSRQMHSRRSQSSPDSSEPETPLPRISTLTAQVSIDGESLKSPINLAQEDKIPHNPPARDSAAIPIRNPTPPGATTSAPAPKRLSIFPAAQPNPTTLNNKNIPSRVRPPSISIAHSNNPYQTPSAKHPIGIQIRASASHGNLLSTLPNPALSSRPKSSTHTTFTPPIRSLKPSRPASKAYNPRTSLPALDFGIPVVGLGPPAPPPSAPLPLPPTMKAGGRRSMSSSRPPSRAPSPAPIRVSGDGLGIRI